MMGNWEEEAEDEYREILRCKFDHSALEQTACEYFRDFPLSTSTFRKGVGKVISELNGSEVWRKTSIARKMGRNVTIEVK
jgi:hypothetical protein